MGHGQGQPLQDLGGPAGVRRQLSPRRLFGSAPPSTAVSPLGRLTTGATQLATAHAFTSAVGAASSLLARPFPGPPDPASQFAALAAAGGGRAPASFIGAAGLAAPPPPCNWSASATC